MSHRNTSGIQDQNVIGDQLFGQLGMTIVVLDFGVVAADNTHGPPDFAGFNGLDQRIGCSPQGTDDGLH